LLPRSHDGATKKIQFFTFQIFEEKPMSLPGIIQKSVKPLSSETLLEGIYPEDYPDNQGYIPIVDEGKFVGFLPLVDIEIEKEVNQTIGQCALERVEQHASETQHLFEVMLSFQKAGLDILPVIGEDLEYEGYIKKENVFNWLSETFAFQSEGGIIVLAVAAIDYSLSEISRLIESNQGKIIGVVVESDPFTHQRLFVHLKINQTDLSRIVATLERFEYQILEVHHKSQANSLDKERLDQLMKYLGM
jgi:acetoin utilization protein AcuB